MPSPKYKLVSIKSDVTIPAMTLLSWSLLGILGFFSNCISSPTFTDSSASTKVTSTFSDPLKKNITTLSFWSGGSVNSKDVPPSNM